jgi:CRISPR-associated endonuclease/helicase Cas3
MMTGHSFDHFFKCAVGEERQSSFPYQFRVATDAWPDLLKVPTGLGKTAAVILAWAYKRLRGDNETPRRLIYCLPMRTLVEQTVANTRSWLNNIHDRELDPTGCLPAEPHVLIGGEAETNWTRSPERSVIVIGTQDMLLSRALMRGYGAGRSRWPVDFALLHNDAMWVFDEVQLMAAGAPTSAQLEGFRRKIGTMAGCRSLWMSATLARDWLDMPDLDASQLTVRELEPADLTHPVVCNRLGAPKRLAKGKASLASAALSKNGLSPYIDALADEVLRKHDEVRNGRPSRTTLVILNRVDRAQALYHALKRRRSPPLLLIHSRFRPDERRKLNEQLIGSPTEPGRIVVATQAVEAGVDVTSAVMFSELAPWASMVQRFGRLNRGAEETQSEAFWIDIEAEAAEKDANALALPYTPEALAGARERLTQLRDVTPRTLESFDVGAEGGWQVLRRKDLYGLFDTDPDLTGFDVDISPYVRGANDTDVRVFWRVISNTKAGPQGSETRRPSRNEICVVSIGRAKAWLADAERRYAKDKVPLPAFAWDWVEKRWARLNPAGLWPGMLVLMDAGIGGYDETRGFDPSAIEPVRPIEVGDSANPQPEGFDDDPDTLRDDAVLLPDHSRHVRDETKRLCGALGVPATEAKAAIAASLWHDFGKAHDVFKARCGLDPDAAPLAKTPNYNWRIKDVRETDGGKKRDRNRRYFRHELASALAWLRHGPPGEDHDLIAYLIAAHHGKVRLRLRALPDERGPDDKPETRFARGVWDGDRLPALSVNELTIPVTELTLDVMEIGGGATGRSWVARTLALLEEYGPFRLAFLEALVRLADWRASEAEQQGRPVSQSGGEHD